jgi:hypothetical protein
LLPDRPSGCGQAVAELAFDGENFIQSGHRRSSLLVVENRRNDDSGRGGFSERSEGKIKAARCGTVG